MRILEAFKKSNAWSSEYNIPCSPQNSNPHFYTALAVRIIAKDEWPYSIIEEYKHFITRCNVSPGLFNRWPEAHVSGGPMSQDELIGIAYMSKPMAVKILFYLLIHDGIYMNPQAGDVLPETQDMYRFYWLEPYLKTCAGYKISLLSQVKYCTYLVADMFTAKPDDASGRLLRWVMNAVMHKWPLCDFVIKLWNKKMHKLGITPKAMLTLEPKENPVYADHAPDTWGS